MSSPPKAVAANKAATAFGVDMDVGSLTGGALRDLRLIADIPPGWFAQQNSSDSTHTIP